MGDRFPEVDVEARVARMRDRVSRLRTSGANERSAKLAELAEALERHRTDAHRALDADFGKPGVEADLTEIGPLLGEIRHARRQLKSWMRPRRAGAPWVLLGTRSKVYYEPKGIVLIIAPWNYPLLLTLGPLVSAVAAGNAVVVKPSEYTPATTQVLRTIVGEVFDGHEVAVVEGDAAVAQDLLGQGFDHVFFTGSARVGREVMRAAADHLTPVTLELGGKSPAVVDASADLAGAAAAIARGTFYNAGQTCVAPDYVLVHQRAHDSFVDELSERIAAFDAGDGPYTRLITDDHHRRMNEMLDDAVRQGARIAAGGEIDVADRRFGPTVLASVTPASDVMQREIFGPLLPVVPFGDLDEVIEAIQARPAPLAVYLFSSDRSRIDRLRGGTRSGALVVNEALVHFVNPRLPFGGVGESGMGRGHGFAGFRTFSVERAVLRRRAGGRLLRLLDPPYTSLTRRVARRLLRFF